MIDKAAKKEYDRRYYLKNRERLRAKQAIYQAVHKERIKAQKAQYRKTHRHKYIAWAYGLDREQYEALLTGQAGQCAGCREPMELPCVDHNHATGEVRGLLCNDCNLVLGRAKDNPATLRRLASYLERA